MFLKFTNGEPSEIGLSQFCKEKKLYLKGTHKQGPVLYIRQFVKRKLIKFW